MTHAVGHTKRQITVAKTVELTHDDGGAGCAICVEITGYQDPRSAREMPEQQFRRAGDAIQGRNGQQAAQFERQLIGIADSAEAVRPSTSGSLPGPGL
jgi:hypothetical protein